MSWDEEMVETLRTGVESSMTGTEISQLIFEKHGIRFTRNAIIGKMHRMGMKSKNEPCANVSQAHKIVRGKIASLCLAAPRRQD